MVGDLCVCARARTEARDATNVDRRRRCDGGRRRRTLVSCLRYRRSANFATVRLARTARFDRLSTIVVAAATRSRPIGERAAAARARVSIRVASGRAAALALFVVCLSFLR